MLGRVTKEGTSTRYLLCGGSASCVLPDLVSLCVTPCYKRSCQHPTASEGLSWEITLGHKENGHHATCSAWLQDDYFLCCLYLNFLVTPPNFPSPFSPKWSIPRRNQTFVLDHISGVCSSFSVQVWILVNCKATYLLSDATFTSTFGNLSCTMCDVPCVYFMELFVSFIVI